MYGMTSPTVVSRVWMGTSFWLFHHLRRSGGVALGAPVSTVSTERPCPVMQLFLKLMRSAAFYETMSHLYWWGFPGAWGVPWSAGFTRCAGITKPSPHTERHIRPLANGHKVTKSQKTLLGSRWGPVTLMQFQ